MKQEPKMKHTVGDKTLVEFYEEIIEKNPHKKHTGIKNRIEVLKQRISNANYNRKYKKTLATS